MEVNTQNQHSIMMRMMLDYVHACLLSKNHVLSLPIVSGRQTSKARQVQPQKKAITLCTSDFLYN